MPKLIELSAWLNQFDPPPAVRTAKRWVDQGRILPPPVRMGRRIYVSHEARYAEHGSEYHEQPTRLIDTVRDQAAQARNQRSTTKPL